MVRDALFVLAIAACGLGYKPPMVPTAIQARLDPELAFRVVGARALHYTTAAQPDDDRPAHVRAASGLAFTNGRLLVIQDDTAFIGSVARDEVAAIALPRGKHGRRRFEAALGNKLDKLDLEACVAIDDEVWALGSGSHAVRERIAVVGYTTRIVDAPALYQRLRAELGHAVNIEGAARVGDQLWLFHRGNTGPGDTGPAVVRYELAAFQRWLSGLAGVPPIVGSTTYDLGRAEGVALGFTDAAAVGERVFYLAAAEASPNAIDDGRVVGSQLGVIDRSGVRAIALSFEGASVKAEGLAFDPTNPRKAWVAIDPDDVDRPAQLLELELLGPW